jgi:sugar lactone lactonase YvrE
LFLLACLLVAACAKKEKPAPQTTAAPSGPQRLASIAGFSTPESAVWDAEQSVWFVSNIGGSPAGKDGDGFISRLRADGGIDSLRFIAGGRGGAVLNAPKGMALSGSALWVSDIDVLRSFDRKTGAPLTSVEFGSDATFLNDVAIGPNGTIYVTDSGLGLDAEGRIIHPGVDRIFAVSNNEVSIAAEGPWLAAPNGLTWDAAALRFVVVSFGGQAILGWTPGETRADTIAMGPGAQDGVEIVDGRMLVTAWADSSMFAVEQGGNRRIARGVPGPADLGVDPIRKVAAVPSFLGNHVELWRIE